MRTIQLFVKYKDGVTEEIPFVIDEKDFTYTDFIKNVEENMHQIAYAVWHVQRV